MIEAPNMVQGSGLISRGVAEVFPAKCGPLIVDETMYFVGAGLGGPVDGSKSEVLKRSRAVRRERLRPSRRAEKAGRPTECGVLFTDRGHGRLPEPKWIVAIVY